MNWNAVLAARWRLDLVDFVRIKCPRMTTRDAVRIAAVDLWAPLAVAAVVVRDSPTTMVRQSWRYSKRENGGRKNLSQNSIAHSEIIAIILSHKLHRVNNSLHGMLSNETFPQQHFSIALKSLQTVSIAHDSVYNFLPLIFNTQKINARYLRINNSSSTFFSHLSHSWYYEIVIFRLFRLARGNRGECEVTWFDFFCYGTLWGLLD